MSPAKLTPPCPLAEDHRLEEFRCTEPSLENWLKQRARKNEGQGASRTYVVCSGGTVVGFYWLSAGAVSHEMAAGSVKRNMPDPVPVVVLGRLAVHSEWTGKGIGRGLLKDALLRSLSIAREMGIRALLCHAVSQSAKDFYLKHGFIESQIDPMTLMLNLSGLREAPS